MGRGRLYHHDCALRAPEETGARTEEGAGKDHESFICGVVVAEEGAGVQGVADTAEGERDFCADCARLVRVRVAGEKRGCTNNSSRRIRPQSQRRRRSC